jgi:hypothetical protein
MVAFGIGGILGLMIDSLALPLLHLIAGPQVDMFLPVVMAKMHGL